MKPFLAWVLMIAGGALILTSACLSLFFATGDFDDLARDMTPASHADTRGRP